MGAVAQDLGRFFLGQELAHGEYRSRRDADRITPAMRLDDLFRFFAFFFRMEDSTADASTSAIKNASRKLIVPRRCAPDRLIISVRGAGYNLYFRFAARIS